MKRTYYIVLAAIVAMFVSVATATAQANYIEQIKVENPTISKRDGITTVAMDVNFTNMKINKNDLIIITPVVVSNENETEVQLEPFVVKGKLRNKVLERPFNWKGKPQLNIPPHYQLVRDNGSSQKIHYATTLPFDEWQRQASLVFRTQVIGCANCSEEGGKTMIDKILPDKFITDFKMPYTVPVVEEIKQRSEQYSAHLNYIVGRHDILPNFENNASVLAKVDNIIRELKSNNDLTITDFKISGYASPEDNDKRNTALSQRRAESFARYMEKKYGYNRGQFKVEWFGEDWDGLKKAVQASDLSNKEAVIQIIDNVTDNDERDSHLIALDNGQTYSRLLREFYPPLRRNDYTIAFVSRPFNVEEAKEIIKKNPKLLSLNEMYHVANTYRQDTPQYKEVFDIACRTFPDAEVACLNASVGELKANNPDIVLQYLQKFDSPAAMNLKAIAYMQKGNYTKAGELFKKAADKGNSNARHNLEQWQLFMEDNM